MPFNRVAIVRAGRMAPAEPGQHNDIKALSATADPDHFERATVIPGVNRRYW